VDEAWAGHPARGHVAAGHAIAIATGAVLPEGADAVVMVEDTGRRDDEVAVRARVEPGQNVSPRASDLSAGRIALDAGLLLTPARVGVVAALGLTEAVVYGRPRVAILSSGDEVVAPGEALGPGQVHDVNSYTLGAVVAASGGEPLPPVRVPDTDAAVERAVRDSLDADLVLVSGGSSVGGRDFVLEVLARLGEIRFHGIAVKPGKPTVLAVVRGRPVIGMPGNPTSCLSNGYLLVGPLVRRMARLPPLEPRTARARLARAVSSPRGRHQFYTVRLERDAAEPAFKGSGDITSMARADGYFEIAADVQRIEAGEEVEITFF
jgi:molybdenum cofactor synthesis domain-containing protein